MKSIYQLLIPGFYLYHSRLKRMSEILSWFYIYPLFIYVSLFILVDLNFSELSIIFLIAFFTWISVYETGYLENDVKTIKRETNPSLRISAREIILIERKYCFLQTTKILIGLIGLIFLFYSFNNLLGNSSVFIFAVVILISRFAYYFHNLFRNKLNIITYFVLSSTKYLAIPLLFSTIQDITIYCISVLMIFPLPRTIEYSASRKFNLPTISKVVGNLDVFRVKYYLSVSILSLFLFYLLKIEAFKISILCSLWFLVYRIVLLTIIKLKIYDRRKFSSHEWK